MIVTFLRFEIVTLTPLRLVDPDVMAGAIDQPAVLDHNGHLYVPPSSLGGSLRAHVRAECAATGRDERPVFGSRLEDQDAVTPDEPLDPSPLRLLGTVTTCNGEPVTVDDLTVTHSTAIDPTRAAAETKTLRSAETSPAGLKVVLYAEYPGELPEPVLQQLASWRPRIGGGRTTGLGRAELRAIRHGTLDLGDPAGLALAIAKGGPDLVDHVATVELAGTATSPEPILSTTWRIVDGLHIGGATTAKEDQSANLVDIHRRSIGGTARPYVEGTTLKGVLRSRCALIERSVRLDGASPVTTALFGTTEAPGLVEISGSEIVDSNVEPQHHVGIDRFTGGAAPGLLWEENVVTAGRLTIEIFGRSDQVGPTGLALLRAALRDVHDGYVGIGGKTSRGLGTIALTQEQATELDDALPLPDTVLSQLQGAPA
jgi:CRISPR/Cas system CSM-associated protein Csm3 (group 7 of RAMP superfamily)